MRFALVAFFAGALVAVAVVAGMAGGCSGGCDRNLGLPIGIGAASCIPNCWRHDSMRGCELNSVRIV